MTLQVVIMTTYSATNDNKVVKLMTFSFQWPSLLAARLSLGDSCVGLGLGLLSHFPPFHYFPSFYPSALRAGGVLSSRFGRAGGRVGGCQTCGTHISVTAWRIFSIRSSEELSRPVVVHCYGHLPICPIWACPWAKNLSNFPQIGSRLCGTHIFETAGWICPI